MDAGAQCAPSSRDQAELRVQQGSGVGGTGSQNPPVTGPGAVGGDSGLRDAGEQSARTLRTHSSSSARGLSGVTRHRGGLGPQEGQGNAVACPAWTKRGRLPAWSPLRPLRPLPASHSHGCARGPCRERHALVSLRHGPGDSPRPGCCVRPAPGWVKGREARGCFRPATSTPALLADGDRHVPRSPRVALFSSPARWSGSHARRSRGTDDGKTTVLPGPGPHSPWAETLQQLTPAFSSTRASSPVCSARVGRAAVRKAGPSLSVGCRGGQGGRAGSVP